MVAIVEGGGGPEVKIMFGDIILSGDYNLSSHEAGNSYHGS